MESKRTLHKAVLTNFNKTPSGKIYEKELKDIFCILIICLNLKEDARFSLLEKQYPYSFLTGQALRAMESLKLNIELSNTTTSICYSIKNELGFALLKCFYDAKCLHCPVDRTRSELKQGIHLQPTAKGVAMVLEFCKYVGMSLDQLPAILDSPYNTMELFKFDRNPLSDKILYSDCFLVLLFTKLMGPIPNVWSPTNKPDSSAVLSDSEDHELSFLFSSMSVDENNIFGGFEFVSTSSKDLLKKKPQKKNKLQNQTSPYHHRYFTNPESDAHSQYYVSTSGVRLFSNKEFALDNGGLSVVDHCTTGKAVCQWLIDCTDTMSVRQAVEIGQLFLKQKLLRPVISTSISDSFDFKSSRNAFYELTRLGKKVCAWNNNSFVSNEPLSDLNFDVADAFIDSYHSSLSGSDEGQVSSKVPLELKDIIRDPGTRYLFKKHLENEFCSENLEAYLKLKEFSKVLRKLGKLLDLRKKYQSDPASIKKVNVQVLKTSSLCSSLAYNVFFTYLSSESPFVLNIDYMLRQQIAMLMISPEAKRSLDPSQTSFLQTPITDKPFESAFEDGESMEDDNLRQTAETSTRLSDSDFHVQTVNYKKMISGPVSPSTPGETNIRETLNNLAKVAMVFDKIMNQIYRLMEIDSLPKFLNSELYRHATYNISFDKKSSILD